MVSRRFEMSARFMTCEVIRLAALASRRMAASKLPPINSMSSGSSTWSVGVRRCECSLKCPAGSPPARHRDFAPGSPPCDFRFLWPDSSLHFARVSSFVCVCFRFLSRLPCLWWQRHTARLHRHTMEALAADRPFGECVTWSVSAGAWPLQTLIIPSATQAWRITSVPPPFAAAAGSSQWHRATWERLSIWLCVGSLLGLILRARDGWHATEVPSSPAFDAAAEPLGGAGAGTDASDSAGVAVASMAVPPRGAGAGVS
mmetsp:Transcript_74944/g.211748  ORF Transcript_74944/g.211748 Transcript_74944/m.211748 type:complete len:258 (+) Transcript_74944:1759-2532(+)